MAIRGSGAQRHFMLPHRFSQRCAVFTVERRHRYPTGSRPLYVGVMAEKRIRVDAREVGRATVCDADFLTLTGVRASGEVYGPRKLVGLTSIGSHFERCSFQKLTVEDAVFGSGRTPSEYVECTFDGSSLRAPVVGWARFESCSFRDVGLTEWRSNADFVDCVFSGRAKNCVFNGRAEDPISGKHLRSVDFRGNDFSAMVFNEVEFWGGIDLRSQRLPSGPQDLYIEDPAPVFEALLLFPWVMCRADQGRTPRRA